MKTLESPELQIKSDSDKVSKITFAEIQSSRNTIKELVKSGSRLHIFTGEYAGIIRREQNPLSNLIWLNLAQGRSIAEALSDFDLELDEDLMFANADVEFPNVEPIIISESGEPKTKRDLEQIYGRYAGKDLFRVQEELDIEPILPDATNNIISTWGEIQLEALNIVFDYLYTLSEEENPREGLLEVIYKTIESLMNDLLEGRSTKFTARMIDLMPKLVSQAIEFGDQKLFNYTLFTQIIFLSTREISKLIEHLNPGNITVEALPIELKNTNQNLVSADLRDMYSNDLLSYNPALSDLYIRIIDFDIATFRELTRQGGAYLLEHPEQLEKAKQILRESNDQFKKAIVVFCIDESLWDRELIKLIAASEISVQLSFLTVFKDLPILPKSAKKLSRHITKMVTSLVDEQRNISTIRMIAQCLQPQISSSRIIGQMTVIHNHSDDDMLRYDIQQAFRRLGVFYES